MVKIETRYLIEKRTPCDYPDCWVRQDIESGADVLRNYQPGHLYCSGWSSTFVDLENALTELGYRKEIVE